MVRRSSAGEPVAAPPETPSLTNTLYGFNIIAKFPKNSDLIQYLNALHEDLKKQEQDVQKAPRGLSTTITHLIAPKVLESPDKQVRVLAACCVVDVLRIYAPESPYRDADMVRVFEMLIAQLRGLETHDVSSPLGAKMCYILESLSSVKSCVVPVILAQNNVPGADEVVMSLCETVINAARPEHDENILLQFAEILHACIEEYEGVSEELLDLLLRPLLPANKSDNPTAFRMVTMVLHAVAPLIQKTVSDVVRRILLGSTMRMGHLSDEISDEIFPIIYELHKISPGLLSDIIPSVVAQLQVEEEEIRHKAVKLLCTLFASEFADYAKEYSRDFKVFLGRLSDRSVTIRSDVLDCCGLLMKMQKADLSTLEEMVAKRLRDPDEAVRGRALRRLLDHCSEHIEDVSANTLHEISERAKDKKIDIRTAAVEGLAKIYYRHVSSQLPPLSSIFCEGDRHASLEEAIAEVVPHAVLERLAMVPGVLLKAWGFPDTFTRHLCVRLVQEYLLPKPPKKSATEAEQAQQEETSDDTEREPAVAKGRASHGGKSRESRVHKKSRRESVSKRAIDAWSDQRATALLFLFRCLDNTDKQCLAALLAFKSKLNDALHVLLRCKNQGHLGEEARATQASTSSDTQSSLQHSQPTQEQSMKLVLSSITQLLPPLVERRALSFDALLSTKDRTVFRLLAACASTKDAVDVALANRDDLARRCESKSVLGAYMSMLYDVAGFIFCNNAMAEALLDLQLSLSATGRSEDVSLLGDVLSLLSRFFPKLFSTSSPHLAAWLQQSLSSSSGRGADKENKRQTQRFDAFHAMAHHCARFLEDEHKQDFCLALLDAMDKERDPALCNRCGEVLNQLVFCGVLQEEKDKEKEKMIALAEDPLLTDVQSFVRKIAQSNALSLRNARLAHVLEALCSFCTISPAMYESLSLLRRCTERMAHALQPLQQMLLDFLHHEVLGADHDALPLKLLALRLWTQLVCLDCEHFIFRHKDKVEERRRERFEPPDDKKKRKNNKKKEKEDDAASPQSESHESDDDEPQYETLSMLLFETLAAHGGMLCGLHVLQRDAQRDVYFAAAQCALQLVRIRSFGDRVSVTNWQELAWALAGVEEERDKAARKELLSSLVSLMHTHPVHTKFLAIPCLFATDGDKEIVEMAQRGLVFALRRLRKTQEELGAKAAAETDPRKREKFARTATNTMPEMVLPYLLYLLSYHPDFPSSIVADGEDDARRMKNIIRVLQSLLAALQCTLPNETGNLPYLFKLLNTINRSYVDKFDDQNIGLHFVTRLTVKLLTQQVRTAENMQVYPGEIALPLDLFAHVSIEGLVQRQFGESVQAGSASVSEGLRIAEKAIDKILQFTGKEKISRIAATITGAPSPGMKKRDRTSGERRRSSASARPRALSLAEDVEGEQATRDEDDEARGASEDESDGRASDKRRSGDGKRPKAAAKKSLPAAAPAAPSRVLPRRSAKGAVSSYEEKEENEAEVREWDESAGEVRRASRGGTTTSSRRWSSPTASVSPSKTTVVTSFSPMVSPITTMSSSARKTPAERSFFEESDEDDEPVSKPTKRASFSLEKEKTVEASSAKRESTDNKRQSTRKKTDSSQSESITDREEIDMPTKPPAKRKRTQSKAAENDPEEEEIIRSRPARKFSSSGSRSKRV